MRNIGMRSGTFWVLCLMWMVTSCTKEEIILIPDNVAPPDATIENITIESYINRAYISLLGRKPEELEFDLAFSTLRTADLSMDSRHDFIDDLTATQEFDQRLFDVSRGLYLNSLDTTSIREQRDVFNILLTQPAYQAFWPQITSERNRLNDLLAVPAGLMNGSIDFREMHRRMVHNYMYDQINMGTQNFVVSMFQNFLFRYPTSSELESGSTMVDGFTATFFLESGRTKEDFIRIFLDSGDYHEGLVRDIFLRTHYREPSTQEIEELTIQFMANENYEALLREVLSTDEFAGI